mgnify:CR=1 FL=1
MRATAGSIGSRGKHCLDEQKNKLLLEHFMGGSINPLGIENQLVLTYCTPFIEKPGILFDFTKLEFGLANYISPTHIHVGPTVRFAPLSFLILRAELTGFYIWPIPLQGAGFIMTKGYDDFNKEMSRFIPQQIKERTIDNPDYWFYVQTEVCDVANSLINKSLVKNKFDMGL